MEIIDMVLELAYYINRELAAGVAPDKVTERVIRLCRARNLVGLLPALLERLKFFAEEEQRRDACQVATPRALSPELLRVVAETFSLSSPNQIRVSVQEDLIAGVRVQYRGQIIDTSTKSMLRRLKQHLEHMVA